MAPTAGAIRPAVRWCNDMAKLVVTQPQVIEMTLAIIKAITAKVDLSPHDLDALIDGVSKGMIAGLSQADADLTWLKTRHN